MFTHAIIPTLTAFVVSVMAWLVPAPADAAVPGDPGSLQMAMADLAEQPIVLAQSGCGHAVSTVKAQTGVTGRLVGVERSGGRVVCVVLILKPSSGGSQPPVPTKVRVSAQ